MSAFSKPNSGGGKPSFEDLWSAAKAVNPDLDPDEFEAQVAKMPDPPRKPRGFRFPAPAQAGTGRTGFSGGGRSGFSGKPAGPGRPAGSRSRFSNR